MSLFSKVFGKKKTVDTSHPHQAQAQHQQAAAQAGPNEQANAFDGFEVVNDIIPDGTPVADVYLNVDTESKSRSHMTFGELMDSNVGHTWLTIKPLGGQLPADLNEMVQPQTRTLVEAHGETAMGFWPVSVRHQRTEGKKISEEKAQENAYENARLKAELALRNAKGFTGGSGTITREEAPNYEMHSTMIGKDTAGRVEEPDDAHTPKGRKIYRITRKQFRNMYRYIDAHRNHKYNLYSYNCTTFAAHALQAADQNVPMEGMTMPTSLYEAMYKEAKQHAKDAEKAKKRHQAIAKSSVELLKLKEGEAHRKKGKSKEGPNGKDVRVKGVDKFEMPMFTDPAEVILKKVVDANEVTEDDKSLFVQHLFKDGHLRTLDGVKAITEEAVKHALIAKGDRDEIVAFYEKGYHLVEDPRAFTTTPELFYDYMSKILNAVPTPDVLTALFDGRALSPEHELNKLCQRVLWNALLSDKTGDDYKNYIMPLNYLVFMEGITTPMVEAFKLAMTHYMNNRKRGDLNRVMHLTSKVFLNDERIRDVVVDYYLKYYDDKITNYLLRDEDFADARAFYEETQIPRVQESLATIERELEVSKQRQFYSGMSNDNQKISTLPKKYAKAKKPKNAPKPDENEIVAEVYLNVDTTEVKENAQVSRTKFNSDSVGHTWLTIKPTKLGNEQQRKLPVDLEAEIENTATGRNTVNIIRAKGETAMGMWPKQNGFVRTDSDEYRRNTDEAKLREDNEKNLDEQAKLDLRKYKGFTEGGGAVERQETQFTGYSPYHNVPGRVEEPDDAHTPKARKRYVITRKQFKKMYRYIEAHRNHFYHILTYNCTTFATHALREAGHKASGSKGGVCYPARMYRELYDEAKKDARHNRASKVKLLKLAKNESHGEYVPGKIGENGENVRVKGVDKFDMVEKYIDESEVLIRKSQLDPGKDAAYAEKIASVLSKNTNIRTAHDATRIADEALRLKLFSPEVAAAVKNLYKNYKGMLEDPQKFKAIPIAKQYDYIKSVKTIADFAHEKKILFPITGSATTIVATEIIKSAIGSPEYETGIKICTELLPGIWDDEFETALEGTPITEDLLNKIFDLNNREIYASANGIAKLIMAYKQDNPEFAFDYILDIYRDPQTSAQMRDNLINPLNVIASVLPNPEFFNHSLQKLKEQGLMSKEGYNMVMTTINEMTAAAKSAKK